jgi:Lon protease-like protein
MEQRTTILDLPLFPLELVLYPGMTLPLHIFEDRYKLMIGRCLAQENPFGVVLAEGGDEGAPRAVGTVAQIVKSVQMADGCYNLITQGASRFRVLERGRQPAGYLTARVELLTEEEEDRGRLAALGAGVQRRFAAFIGDYARLAGKELDPIAFPDDPTGVSYFVASHLPLELGEKQRLLEAPSTDARLADERRILARERDILRLFATARAPYEPDEVEEFRVVLSPN